MNAAVRTLLKVCCAVGALALAACATVPAGPTVGALPGSKKSWDQFQADDASCRGYAVSVTGSPNDAAAQAGVGSAVAGTIIGAAIGGLIGGSDGAAVGAGLGLFTGSAYGVGNAQAAGSVTQQRYDGAYYQCMYGLGNRVPAPAGYVARNSVPAARRARARRRTLQCHRATHRRPMRRRRSRRRRTPQFHRQIPRRRTACRVSRVGPRHRNGNAGIV